MRIWAIVLAAVIAGSAGVAAPAAVAVVPAAAPATAPFEEAGERPDDVTPATIDAEGAVGFIPWAQMALLLGNALNSAFGAANKAWGTDKDWTGKSAIQGARFNMALAFVGPIIFSIFGGGTGPDSRIDEMIDRLEEMRQQLDRVEQHLDAIEREILQVDLHVLVGTCTTLVSELSGYQARLQAAQDSYSAILEETARLKPGDSGAILQQKVDDFVEVTLGPTNTTVGNGPLALGVRTLHVALTSGLGGPGIIESCGTAYLEQWRAAALSSRALEQTAVDEAGVWVDDRQYYESMQTLLGFWQIAQSQGVFLLQQAALLKANKEYARAAGSADPDPRGVCALAAEHRHISPAATTLCESGQSFSDTVYANLAAQWRQAGVPYTDDRMILSLGTDITGLQGPDDTAIPTTLWARSPGSIGADWSTGTWDQSGARHALDPVIEFTPADAGQWRGLIDGYRLAHPAAPAPEPQAVRQPWRAEGPIPYPLDPWGPSGLEPFAPMDILQTMHAVRTGVDATRAFESAGIDQVWIPGATVRRAPIEYRDISHWSFIHRVPFPASYPATIFPPGVVLDGVPNHEGGFPLDIHMHPYYADNAPTLRCQVVRVDGILCDEDTVAAWWTARQVTEFSVESSNHWTANYTGRAVFTVEPSVPSLGAFSGAGRNAGCTTAQVPIDRQCAITLNLQVTVPPWLERLDGVDGRHYSGEHTLAALWPAAALPTAAACGTGWLTVWGMPTRCGASMEAWIADNVPDPSVSGPWAAQSSAVVDAGDGAASCTDPVWEDAAGRDIRYDDTSWTVTAEGSATRQVAHGANVSIAELVAANGGSPTRVTLSCVVSARYAEYANRGYAASDTVVAELRDGVWRIMGVPNEPDGSGGDGSGPEGTGDRPGAGVPGTGGDGAAPATAAPGEQTPGRGDLARTGADHADWIWAGFMLSAGLAAVGAVLVLVHIARRPLRTGGRGGAAR